MKKNKLYMANRWNQPAFMSPRGNNLFWGEPGFSSQMNNNPFGVSLNTSTVNTPRIDWSNPIQKNMALGQTGSLTSSFGSSNPINLQQSNQMLSKTISRKPSSFVPSYYGGQGNPNGYIVNTASATQINPGDIDRLNNSINQSAPLWQNNNSNNGGLFGKDTWSKGGAGWGMAGAAASALGSINTGEKRGMWDTLDPVHHLAGGRESGAGNAMEDAGVALTQAGLSTGNPYLMLAGAGAKVLGGLTNATFGIKTDQARLNQINEGLETANNFVSDASTFDDIEAPISIASADGVYEGGLFSGRRAARKNAKLKARRAAAVDWMDRSVSNNIYNITNDFIGTNMRNYAAFGGPLDTSYDDMGAVNYGFMSDYLTQKKRENDMKNKMSGIPSVPAFMPNSFAIGGDLQINGGDFSDGLTIIGAGGSHETNPNEGIQLGTDENGTPNLVEEGETIFNNYVFSARIPIDNTTKEMFHIGKKREMTYADLSKKLEKEIAERSNDPISKAGFEKQMQMLEEQQERQKAEMEAERAREAFEALSPEEKVTVMENAAQQEAMAQQAAMTGGAQISPEEAAMMEQEVPDEAIPQPTENMVGQPIMAEGGHLYPNGGTLAWAKQKGFSGRTAEAIASALDKYMSTNPDKWVVPGNINLLTGKRGPSYVDYDMAYNSLIPTLTNRREHYFNEWVKLGLPRNLAFGITYRMPHPGDKRALREREEAFARLVTNHGSTPATPRPAKKPVNTTSVSTEPPIPWGTGNSFVPATNNTINNAPFYEAYPYVASTSEKIAPTTGTTDNTPSIEPTTPATTRARVVPTAQAVAPAVTPAATSGGTRDWRPYDWYRNGSDGTDVAPTGFTVGANGLIDRENGYTQEYRDLVARLGADDIRKWAKAHPDDTSLLSFLAKGNKLENLTDEQWRRGALDGKFGFMHHVASDILREGSTPTTPTETPIGTPRTYHAMDGDLYDGYIEGELGPNVGEEVRRETLPNGDVVIYHKPNGTPATPESPSDKPASSTTVPNPESTSQRRIRPVYRNEALRYAGLFGPAVGLGMQMAGIGKPDTSGLDAALNISRGAPHLAKYKPIGNYLTYKPMDIWFEQNRNDANSRATDRMILNNSAPVGTRMAGLLANSYNNQIANGQLFRQALEYNDAQRKNVTDFNRTTDMFNADAYNRLSQFNASARNNARQANAQLGLHAAAQKMNADAAWNSGIYGNVAGLFKGIGDLGRENYQHNRIADMAATELFGTINPDTFVANGYLTWDDKKRSKGGKINRKKGGRK